LGPGKIVARPPIIRRLPLDFSVGLLLLNGYALIQATVGLKRFKQQVSVLYALQVSGDARYMFIPSPANHAVFLFCLTGNHHRSLHLWT